MGPSLDVDVQLGTAIAQHTALRCTFEKSRAARSVQQVGRCMHMDAGDVTIHTA
jgi:hypothetical protein